MSLSNQQVERAAPKESNLKLEKRRTAVGPWKNVAEFNNVHKWIYANTANHETRCLALDQIHVWQLRRGNLCPAAVLATAVILEVQVKDVAKELDSSVLQTLYASAFSRFFNYMSSIMQTYSLRSMYDTASQLGLQSFIVDLRHICSHGQVLPTLEVLRNTAAHCIEWLRHYFWIAQDSAMSDVDANCVRRKDQTEFDNSVLTLFKLYDTALECFMKGARNTKEVKQHIHGKRFIELKRYWAQRNLETMHVVLDTIVKDLAVLIKRETNIKDLPESITEAFLKMKYFFAVADSAENSEYFECLIGATQSLFRMLAVRGLIQDLFQILIQVVENSATDAVRRLGMCFWAKQIIAGFVAYKKYKQMSKDQLDANPNLKETDFSTEKITKKNRKLLFCIGVDVTRTLIFGDSFRCPWVWNFERSFLEQRLESLNSFTAPILKSLLPLLEPPLASDEMETFIELIDTYFNHSTKKRKVTNASMLDYPTHIYTAEELVSHLNDNVPMSENKDKTGEVFKTKSDYNNSFGIWTLLSDHETHNWNTCPLGKVPWE